MKLPRTISSAKQTEMFKALKELQAQKKQRQCELDEKKATLAGCWHVTNARFSDRDIDEFDETWQSERHAVLMLNVLSQLEPRSLSAYVWPAFSLGLRQRFPVNERAQR